MECCPHVFPVVRETGPEKATLPPPKSSAGPQARSHCSSKFSLNDDPAFGGIRSLPFLFSFPVKPE